MIIFRKLLPYLISFGIIIMLWLYYSNKVNSLESEVNKVTKEYNDLSKRFIYEQLNTEKLQGALEKVNKDLEKLELNKKEALDKLEAWKNSSEKFEKLYNSLPKPKEELEKGICEQGLELNRYIEELKYEDL